MLEIRNIILLIKYIALFMTVIITSHVISNASLNRKQCALIALSAATAFIILDHVAPLYVTQLENNVVIKTCGNVELNENI